jgi:hypothetical protein
MRALLALCLFLAACGRVVASPIVSSKTDTLILGPLGSAPSCPSGKACLYALTADNQIYDVDAAGLVLKHHAAKSFRTSANCAALASPAAGDVCYDTSSSVFRFYSAGWVTGTTDDSLVVHKAGTETVTGAKTFSAAVTLSAGATLGANLAGGGFKGTGFGQGTSSGELLHAGRTINTSAPLTGGAALTGDLTLGLSVSSPLAVGGGSLGIAAAGLVDARIDGGGTGALGAATLYLTAPGQAASATEIPLSKATRAGTARNLSCELGTAPGGADTVVVTVRINAADAALTCTISGAATTCSDTSNTAAVSAGHRLAIKAVSSAGTAADLTCSFEQTN